MLRATDEDLFTSSLFEPARILVLWIQDLEFRVSSLSVNKSWLYQVYCTTFCVRLG